jgi:hypothetical protein
MSKTRERVFQVNKLGGWEWALGSLFIRNNFVQLLAEMP